jgi:hypothetical protein
MEASEVVKVRIPVKTMEAVRKKAEQDDRTAAYVIRMLLTQGLGKKR